MKIVERTMRMGAVRGVIIDGIVDENVRGRNFKGLEKRHRVTGRVVNGEGNRNFLLYLSDEVAEELKTYGCEVQYTKPQDENDIPKPYIAITVSYYLKPVEVHLISNGVATPRDEAHVGDLDDVDFKNVCLVLEFGKEKVHQSGIKYIPVYASQIVAEIVPSYIAARYGDFLNQPIMPPTGVESEVPFV